MVLTDEQHELLLADPVFQELVELMRQEMADLVARGFTLEEVQGAWARRRARERGETQE